MTLARGIIAIMGSGETTDSMVRVHRSLLEKIGPSARAVFLDTPAGFQMNADDLYEKAKEYFQKRLGQSLERVSFKSKHIPIHEAEKAYQILREANYIFVGPGSPTYALKNWAGTPIPQIIADRVREGGCFVAASAAALTLGRFTLPVYEIYKVGEDLHWTEGLDLLGEFGLALAVIPHWNNAEGGTHDTRFCYMGEPRLMRLESLLPPDIPILGIDEHTACILDFPAGRASIRGVGGITLRRAGRQAIFRDGENFSFEECRDFLLLSSGQSAPVPPLIETLQPTSEPFPEQVNAWKESFERALQEGRSDPLIEILLNLEKAIWKSYRELADEEQISQARQVLRGMIVQLGLRLDELPKDVEAVLSPVMEILLEVRGRLRSFKQWELADSIREDLSGAGIIIEDTPEGSRWHLEQGAKS